jgi:hypothetical protein
MISGINSMRWNNFCPSLHEEEDFPLKATKYIKA